MSLAPETLSRLQAIVGETRVRTDADSLKTWGCDWTKMYTPAPTAIVFPSSIEQVQAVVLLANEVGCLRAQSPPMAKWSSASTT